MIQETVISQSDCRSRQTQPRCRYTQETREQRCGKDHTLRRHLVDCHEPIRVAEEITMLALLASWLQFVIPQPCFDKYFTEYDFLNGECFKVVVSKGLGYGIIVGSILVKVPQIVKILNAKSAQGISILSTSLELAAVTASLAYGYNKGFPFSAYGEAGFLVLQTAIIAFLIFFYGGNVGMGVFYTTVFTAFLGYLMSGQAPTGLITGLQSAVIPNVVIARMIQVVTNIKNGSTGQLSLVTVFLLFAGSLARIFTSLQETGDNVLVMTYIVSTACNFLILFQIFYYSNKTKTSTQQKKKPKRS